MKKLVYAGSFDPLTSGHLWMIEQGAKICAELVIAVGKNPDKKSRFSLSERLNMLKLSTLHIPNVSIVEFDDRYLAQYAKQIGATHILRGIRNGADFGYEQTIYNINMDIEPSVQTVFLIPPKAVSDVSSSLVMGLIGPQGWPSIVTKYVPQPVLNAILAKELRPLLKMELASIFEEFTFDDLYENIVTRMSEPQRAYHTLEHIYELLLQLNKINFSKKPQEKHQILLAILYHDIIYDVKRQGRPSNEELSAKHMEDTLLGVNCSSAKQMVLATETHISKTHAEKLFLDLDLSILGSSEERYKRYSDQIRREYAWVPEGIYKAKRKEILTSFLSRQDIFHTPEFKLLEVQAKENLKREIKDLS